MAGTRRAAAVASGFVLAALVAAAAAGPPRARASDGDDAMGGGMAGGAPGGGPGTSSPSVPARPRADEAELALAARAVSRAIDREVDAALAKEGVKPTGPSDDAAFLRRLSLDLTGVIPGEDEVRAFLSDRDPGKRAAKIEELLASPLYGERMSELWGQVLFGRIRRYRQQDREVVADWLAAHFQDGRGLDALARSVLTATGNTNENPALAFVMRFRDGGIPADIAGVTSRVFLGVQVQCAQCHDHPYERWTMQDFAGMAAFFNLVQPRRVDPADPRSGFVVEDPDPRVLERRRARGGTGVGADIRGAADAEPRFLAGAVHRDRAGTTRRGALADWITARDNPYFARAAANRVWSWLFGRGIVNPVDDFRSDNPPSHPGILDTLAIGFAESGYDMRFLLRAIVQSETYGRTSAAPEAAAGDPTALRRLDLLFGRGPVKPLTADQVFDSLLRATGMDAAARRANRGNLDRMRTQLLQQFVTTIDDDEMNEADQFAGTIPQGLLLMNGPLTQFGTRTGAPRGRTDPAGALLRFNGLSEVLSRTKDPATRLRRLWLLSLGRYPTDDEAREAAAFAMRGKGDQGWEDLFWALLNSSEFHSNH